MTSAYKGLLNSLVIRGKKLSAKQIAHLFGVANPGDLVYRLRNDGFDVQLDTFTDTKGRVTRKYHVA